VWIWFIISKLFVKNYKVKKHIKSFLLDIFLCDIFPVDSIENVILEYGRLTLVILYPLVICIIIYSQWSESSYGYEIPHGLLILLLKEQTNWSNNSIIGRCHCNFLFWSVHLMESMINLRITHYIHQLIANSYVINLLEYHLHNSMIMLPIIICISISLTNL